MGIDTLISEVRQHLQDVYSDPTVGLNEKLLNGVDTMVTEAISEPDRDTFLNQLSELLPLLQQDPTPITNLIQILIYSSHPYDFSRVLSITPPVDFVAGLSAPLSPINLVTLALLKKAKQRTSDVGIVAGKPDVVGALVRLWLCTTDTAVASKAHDVLLGLLMADDIGVEGQGFVESGLLWRRVFRDKDIYASIFSICSLSTAEQPGQPNKRDKTVAQARLLDVLLQLDNDSSPIRRSQLRNVEQQYGLPAGGSLLEFAAKDMIDYRNDVLMHMTLIDFYAKYISSKDPAISKYGVGVSVHQVKYSSFPLEFLRKHGLHDRTLQYYLNPDKQDPLDLSYLYGSSAQYHSTYSSTYPQDVLKQAEFVNSTLARLRNVLQSISPGQWAQGKSPKHDLNVLASLPRATLLSKNDESPMFLIPAKSATPDTFNTLAHIFHGVEGQVTESRQMEKAAARALYFLYTERSPTFWTKIIAAAEAVAVKDIALAAISLIGSIITENWSLLPNTSTSDPFPLPTESQLSAHCHHSSSLPLSGIETIMSEPAIGIVVPYLMKPAQTFSNLVGGGRGDVESAAYKVAVAKHDVLRLLYDRLRDWVGNHPDAREMVATVGRRVSQGPMGGSSEVGGRVGTLEL